MDGRWTTDDDDGQISNTISSADKTYGLRGANKHLVFVMDVRYMLH